MPAALQKGNLTIYSTEECNSTNSYNGFISYGMICAAGQNEFGIIDSCQGQCILIVSMKYIFLNDD